MVNLVPIQPQLAYQYRTNMPTCISSINRLLYLKILCSEYLVERFRTYTSADSINFPYSLLSQAWSGNKHGYVKLMYYVTKNPKEDNMGTHSFKLLMVVVPLYLYSKKDAHGNMQNLRYLLPIIIPECAPIVSSYENEDVIYQLEQAESKD